MQLTTFRLAISIIGFMTFITIFAIMNKRHTQLSENKATSVAGRYPKEGVLQKRHETLEVVCGSKAYPVYNNEAPEGLLGLIVCFEILDEFTHPELFENVGWGDGIIYATNLRLATEVKGYF